MLKATKQNGKFKHAIIQSIVLHCILIAILIWSSIHQPLETSTRGGSESVIDAVMVDPGAVVLQYNHKQHTDAPSIQKQCNKQAQQWEEGLQQKQSAEQQRLKMLEKKRQMAQEVVRAEKQQQKWAADTAAVKKQMEEQVKQIAAQEKAVVDSRKKAAVEAVKQSSEVDDLLGSLSDVKNAPKSSSEPKSGRTPDGTGKNKQNGASRAEINAYKVMVSRAISNKFYNALSHRGKTCDLHIKLASDGMLISVTAAGGDPALCQAAVSAAKLATIPKPPSPQVYEVFKNMTLGFSPQ